MRFILTKTIISTAITKEKSITSPNNLESTAGVNCPADNFVVGS